MSFLKDLTCAMFGHHLEIEASDDVLTTKVYCSRCGGGNMYHWILDDDFIRKHGIARDDRENNSD